MDADTSSESIHHAPLRLKSVARLPVTPRRSSVLRKARLDRHKGPQKLNLSAIDSSPPVKLRSIIRTTKEPVVARQRGQGAHLRSGLHLHARGPRATIVGNQTAHKNAARPNSNQNSSAKPEPKLQKPATPFELSEFAKSFLKELGDLDSYRLHEKKVRPPAPSSP